MGSTINLACESPVYRELRGSIEADTCRCRSTEGWFEYRVGLHEGVSRTHDALGPSACSVGPFAQYGGGCSRLSSEQPIQADP